MEGKLLNSIIIEGKLLIALLLILSIHTFAQLDVPYVFLHKNLSPQTLTKSPYIIYSSPIHNDAKSIGRGRTNMMLGSRNGAVWQNPAFLSYKKISVELTNAQVVLPQTTIDAIAFVREYNDNFANGKFLTDVRDGLNKAIKGSTEEERKAGLAQYNSALSFIEQMTQEIAYTDENPNIHGVSIFPKIQVQYKNWGMSLFKSTNIAFAITPGNIVTALTKSKINKDLNIQQVVEVAELLYHSIDSEGNISANGLPRIFSVSFDDWIGILAYGRQINKHFRLGGSFKFIGRGFSTDAIDSKDSYDALFHAGDKLKTKYFFVTSDIGGLYHFNKNKTTLGFTFQNIIPCTTVPSQAQFNYTESNIEIPKDVNGKPYVGRVENNEFVQDPSGDTLIL